MERFPGKRFSNGFRLRSIAPEHNNACVVVFHRQASIVLRFFHLPHVFARLYATERQIAGARDGVRRELLWVTSINPPQGTRYVSLATWDRTSRSSSFSLVMGRDRVPHSL